MPNKNKIKGFCRVFAGEPIVSHAKSFSIFFPSFFFFACRCRTFLSAVTEDASLGALVVVVLVEHL